jgi:hypothetical protein
MGCTVAGNVCICLPDLTRHLSRGLIVLVCAQKLYFCPSKIMLDRFRILDVWAEDLVGGPVADGLCAYIHQAPFSRNSLLRVKDR